jgi:hypothetical protein
MMVDEELKRLQDQVEIIAATMEVSGDLPVDLLTRIQYLRHHAYKSIARKDRIATAQEKYAQLKSELAELEFDYPELKNL